MTRLSIITGFAGSTAHLLPDFRVAVRASDEVVIVDDGSDEVTAAELRAASAKEPGWRYVRNETSVGFSAANNQGYTLSTGDVVLFLNSDVKGPPGWSVAVLRDVLQAELVGPSVQHQFVYGMRLPYVEGWCVAATRKTWERIRLTGSDGPWDARAYPGPYWEDNDLSFRALRAGVDLRRVEWAIYHKGGQTFGPLLKYGASFEENRATFAARVRPAWEDAMRGRSL